EVDRLPAEVGDRGRGAVREGGWGKVRGGIGGVVTFALMVCGCGAGASVDARIDDTGAVLPDTHTLNDVLVMDHHAAALRAAQQFLIDDTPSVVYDGGMDRDLALASHFS